MEINNMPRLIKKPNEELTFLDIPLEKDVIELLLNGATIIKKQKANKQHRYNKKSLPEFGILLQLTDKQIEETKNEKYPNGFNYAWASTYVFDKKPIFTISGYFNMTKREAINTFVKKIGSN
jgi:hypothetical protein